MKPNQPQHGTNQQTQGGQRPGATQGTQQTNKTWNNPNAAGQTGGNLNRPNQGKTTINPKDSNKGTGTTGTGGNAGGRKF